ncbi:hypothetical protein AB1Y20_018852 [Prymnesium parvum]|uniref:Uncharacterized protein n=1 Tax=Prymnesium parvum TaxID=97485 RepID=A0AB34JTH3_PRYPA|mmetsp:Transcript_35596/g.81471  ORF Transcript_35596/g.81471 Transcript_35596/m.81471 type:complete len:165 (+) Transcript_35596:127-621(+)
MGFMNNISKSITKASDEVNRAAISAQLSTQSAFYAQEIAFAKGQWGKEAFDAFVNGDMAKVHQLAQATLAKVKPLEEKKALVDAKKAGGASGDPRPGSSTNMPPPPPKVTVTIPEGAKPGSTFIAQLPSGQQVCLTVPPGAEPGAQVVFDVPPAPAVVIGQPVC